MYIRTYNTSPWIYTSIVSHWACIFVTHDGQIFMHCVSFECHICSGQISWKESFTLIEYCVHEQISQEIVNCKNYSTYITWTVLVHLVSHRRFINFVKLPTMYNIYGIASNHNLTTHNNYIIILQVRLKAIYQMSKFNIHERLIIL